MGRLRPVGPQGVYGRRSDQARLAQPGQHGDRLVQAVQQPVARQREHAGGRQRLSRLGAGGWRRRAGPAARQLGVVPVIASSVVGRPRPTAPGVASVARSLHAPPASRQPAQSVLLLYAGRTKPGAAVCVVSDRIGLLLRRRSSALIF